jgi:hypothetical protein
MINKVNMNLNFSKELCEIFNKDCKSPVNFIPSASSDSIVNQIVILKVNLDITLKVSLNINYKGIFDCNLTVLQRIFVVI